MPFTLADRPLARTSPRTMLSGPPNVFVLAARPDLEALAARLFEWELHSEWETFYGTATTYTDLVWPRPRSRGAATSRGDAGTDGRAMAVG